MNCENAKRTALDDEEEEVIVMMVIEGREDTQCTQFYTFMIFREALDVHLIYYRFHLII